MSVEDIIAFNWIQELKTKAEQWIGRTFTSGWENLGDQIELLLSFFENGGQLTDKDIPVKKIIINNILEYPIIGEEYGYEIPPINSTRVFKYQNTFGIYNLKWSGASKNGGEYRRYPNWTIITPNIKEYDDKFSFTEQYTNFQSIAEISSPIPTQAESHIYIAINGRCKVMLSDGKDNKIVQLDKREQGLYIGHNVWREIYDFSEEAVLLVLASEKYDESDYIRDYDSYLKSL